MGSLRKHPVCRFLSATIVLLAILSALSCSGHAPELTALEYRLSIRPLDPAASRVQEQLAIFAAVRDEDGFKDLAALHVLHDGSEYLWTLLPDFWTRRDQNKEIWVGFTGLSSPDLGPLPRGLYRVVLEDLSGDSDQVSFTLGAGIEKGLEFPSVHQKGDSLSVASKYPRTELFFLDADGKIIRTIEAPRDKTSLDTLYGSESWKRDVKSVLAYAFDPERNLGIYSWNIKIQP